MHTDHAAKTQQTQFVARSAVCRMRFNFIIVPNTNAKFNLVELISCAN